jgi:hypothetical protein
VSSLRCGSEFVKLKTLRDAQRDLVILHPKTTTVAAINRLPMPHPTPKRRNTEFARRVWRVTAQVVRFRLEDNDNDIHAVLFSDGAYMIAELPKPECLPKKATRDRKALVAARLKFEKQCGKPTLAPKPLGAVARISGVGFWDFPHGQDGHADNYAEFHPVTGVTFIAGCGA